MTATKPPILIFLLAGTEGASLCAKATATFNRLNQSLKIYVYHTGDGENTINSNAVKSQRVTFKRLENEFIPEVYYKNYAEYSTSEFNQKTLLKWKIIKDAMEEYKTDVIYSDLDITCLRELPIPLFQRIWRQYPIFTQDEGVEVFPRHPCTGFMGFRQCRESMDHINAIEKIQQEACGKIHDQTAAWLYLNKNQEAQNDFYFLPQYLFPVGYLLNCFNQTIQSETALPNQAPYIFHANWATGIRSKELALYEINRNIASKLNLVVYAKSSEAEKTFSKESTKLWKSTTMLSPFPFVSVCTITHNRHAFLPLLRSCIACQDYPLSKVQWVILDDSDANTSARFDSNNLRIPGVSLKYQRLPHRLALGNKRNLSHSLCDGEYIIYMDDDDYYFPSRITHSIRRLLESGLEIAGSTKLFIHYTQDNQTWLSGPFAGNHATAGTFAMSRALAKTHFYNNLATCNEEKDFLENYSIPLAQLNPLHTMICMSHEFNTFDKRKMRESGETPRMRRLSPQEEERIFTDINTHAYRDASMANACIQKTIAKANDFK